MAGSTRAPLPELATRGELAEYLQMSAATLDRWAVSGKGPKFVKLEGDAVRYRSADVLEWIEAQGAPKEER